MGPIRALLRRGRTWLGVGNTPPPQVPPAAAVPETIDDVVARMKTIDAHLPRRDGVAWFNRMYLQVTEDVRDASRDHHFEDREFLERLDVVFANLYLKALDDYADDPATCSRAWVPLIEARSIRRIAPIQFALSGMNAHINRDLVVAVVETCKETGREPVTGSAVHRDFVYINELLAQAQEKVEPWLKRGVLAFVDRIFGRADEVVEMWSITRARQAAWVEAQSLWALRHDEELCKNFLVVLDRTVGFAGRGLLAPRLLF